MKDIDTPLYETAPTKTSLGNAYSIYSDRIELRCRFPFVTKTLVIKKDDLISIDTYKPPVIRTTFRALKNPFFLFIPTCSVKSAKSNFKALNVVRMAGGL